MVRDVQFKNLNISLFMTDEPIKEGYDVEVTDADDGKVYQSLSDGIGFPYNTKQVLDIIYMAIEESELRRSVSKHYESFFDSFNYQNLYSALDEFHKDQ